MGKASPIRDLAIQLIAEGDLNPIAAICKKLEVSRQAAHRQLRQLVSEGVLRQTGRTRARKYELVTTVDETIGVAVAAGTAEDRIWRESVAPLLGALPDNVLDICHYGFTEMFNNVVDHSGSPSATIDVKRSAGDVRLTVADKGIGILEKITRELSLDDHRHAILELAKGKLTTDAERHTGEGIFFTSRMFDTFSIQSGDLSFVHFAPEDDWLVDANGGAQEGTAVLLAISVFSKRRMQDVFTKYASQEDDYGFSRTRVPVRLLRYGKENLVSRSQAKRLLARFDRFKEVVLDFKGVSSIGRAFADEIFRVFTTSHRDTHLYAINASKSIKAIIGEVLGRAN